MNPLGRYARWRGSSGTLKSWPTQVADVGRTPYRAKEVHRPSYPTRRGLVTTWQETKKLLHDDGFEYPKEKNIDLTRIGEATRNREVWRNLVRASSSARRWKREKKKSDAQPFSAAGHKSIS